MHTRIRSNDPGHDLGKFVQNLAINHKLSDEQVAKIIIQQLDFIANGSQISKASVELEKYLIDISSAHELKYIDLIDMLTNELTNLNRIIRE